MLRYYAYYAWYDCYACYEYIVHYTHQCQMLSYIINIDVNQCQMETVHCTNSKTNTTQEDNYDNEGLNEVPSKGSESHLTSEVFNEY